MDVHDAGDYRERGERDAQAGSAADSANASGAVASGAVAPPWRTLRPGMTLTIEPGLYVRAAEDVPERYWDIGIRIEDDAIVTATGCELITRGVPVAADEIEALMQDARHGA
ncbi:MAG: M24 family metallopeptidase, partial [Paraburkholderia sp.]|jgi:Xaa-Pro aminopeptidase|nr:M24 family metallopeptidase [Paraburkholderia sp.]